MYLNIYLRLCMILCCHCPGLTYSHSLCSLFTIAMITRGLGGVYMVWVSSSRTWQHSSPILNTSCHVYKLHISNKSQQVTTALYFRYKDSFLQSIIREEIFLQFIIRKEKRRKLLWNFGIKSTLFTCHICRLTCLKSLTSILLHWLKRN